MTAATFDHQVGKSLEFFERQRNEKTACVRFIRALYFEAGAPSLLAPLFRNPHSLFFLANGCTIRQRFTWPQINPRPCRDSQTDPYLSLVRTFAKMFSSLMVRILRIAFIVAVTMTSGCFSLLERVGENHVRSMTLTSSAVEDSGLLTGGQVFGPKQIARTAARLQQSLNFLKRYHDKRSQDLSKIFGPRVLSAPSVRVVVSNRDAAIAAVDATGKIELDIRVIRAILRTSVLSGLKDDAQSRPPYATVDNQSDEALISRFHKLTVDLQKRDANSLDTVMDGYEVINRINNKYWGAIQFLLAHELGHIALRHKMGETLACATFRQQEQEADIYAAFMLADIFALHAMMEGPFEKFADYTGHELFFALAYKSAGFHSNLVKGCSYPDPSERRGLLKYMHDQLAQGYREQAFAELRGMALKAAAKSKTGEFNVEKTYGPD